MDFLGFNKIARWSREIIVTEKIDGTNAQIYIGEDGEFLTGSRTQWITPKNDNFGFSRWAHEHKYELITGLGVGRHFGEWWGQGIQRHYGLKEKRFSLFNVSRWESDTVRPACCYCVPVLWQGQMDAFNINFLMESFRFAGSYASPGFIDPEGIVLYHIQGNIYFKKTFKKDVEGKGNNG